MRMKADFYKQIAISLVSTKENRIVMPFCCALLLDKNTAKYIDLLPFQHEKIPFSNLSRFIWWLMKNKLIKLSPVME